jgi:hypothetical protein
MTQGATASNRRSESLYGHTGNNFSPEPPKKFTTLEINVSELNGSEVLSSSFYRSQACPRGKNLLRSNAVLLVASCNKEETFGRQLFSALCFAAFIGWW